MLRPILAVLAFSLASCSSVEWAKPDPELPSTWRHYQLFVSDAAYVLARDEDAAADAHELATEARQVMAAVLNAIPAAG